MCGSGPSTTGASCDAWSPAAESRASSPTGPTGPSSSGRPDREVLLATERAEVGRPVEDERRRRVADPEADVDRAEDLATADLVTRERVAAGDAGDGDRRAAPGVDELQVVGRRVGGDARVLELDCHADDVVLYAHLGDPQRVAAEVDARAR